MSEITPIKPISFACPKCKRPLHSGENALQCSECNRTYPIEDGIPDFISGDSSLAPVSSMAKKVDLMAPIYESRLWYQLALRLGGAISSSVGSIARFHSETLEGITGSVLDVACGPATYGRRIASPSRSVYGIDISMGMLRQGMTYIVRDHVPGVHLARSRVEELPFEDAVFDGAICSGSLHLFPDTVLSLREIERTMKTGAPLSVQTFIAGKAVINRLLKPFQKVRSFELLELQKYLTEAGFEGFRSKLDGVVLTFSTRKAMPRT
jgi:SAM-dependent methyltransferase